MTAEPRRVLVTGASRGIGRAVAVRLGVPGGVVVLNHAGDPGPAEEAAAEVEAAGARAHVVRCDALSEAGAVALAAEAVEHAGGLDTLVHCAVQPVTGTAMDTDSDALRYSIERNGLSLLWLVRACAPALAPGSSVVFVTSRGGRCAVPGYAPLGLAKALGESLVRYLAAELAPRGVRVNAVSPGAIDTVSLRTMRPDADRVLAAAGRHSPAGRSLTADDVAAAVALLSAPGLDLVQGQVLQIDGGLELIS